MDEKSTNARSSSDFIAPNENEDSNFEMIQELIRDAESCHLFQPKNDLRNIMSRDLITNLIHHNCHEVIMNIWCSLDARSLSIAELVSRSWRMSIANSIAWQNIVVNLVETTNLWHDLAYQRGWIKFLRCKLNDITKGYYRNLYWSVMKDIKKLHYNWNFGIYRCKKITCGNHGDQKGIYCFQYNETYLYSGHRDHMIRIWNINSTELQATMRGHAGSVLSLRVEGNLLVSGSSDTSIRLWCLTTLTCISVMNHHLSSVLHVWFVKDRIISSSKDKTMAVWQVSNNSMRFLASLKGHKAAVNAVEFDDKYIVSASGDSSIKIWNPLDFKNVRTLQDHRRGIACLHYQYPLIVSGSSDSDIRIWDVEQGACLRTLRGHTELVRCVCFNERHIISGSYDGCIMIWNFRVAMMPNAVPLVGTLNKHIDRVFRLQADQLKFVSSSHDDTIMIWNFLDPSMDNPLIWRPKRFLNVGL